MLKRAFKSISISISLGNITVRHKDFEYGRSYFVVKRIEKQKQRHTAGDRNVIINHKIT